MQIATRQQKLITNVAKLPRLAPCSHGLSIILVALILCLPPLFSGIPIAGDVVTHVQYQRHFSEQFWAGELYPRWLMNANKGYGSPIFLVQYPVPYWTTALIRAVVRFQPGPGREARELGLFCFLAVAAAGLSARYWFTRRFGSLPATAAAILYMGLPYFVPFALYKSAAIGQLAAAAWMPLTLAAADSNLRSRASSTLALAVALLIMSNLITAALFLPLLVAYAIASGRSRGMSMSRLFGSVLLAVALGFGVAAVYILPAAIYRPLFDLNVWSFLTSSYFAFVRAGNLTVPIVVASLSAAIVVAGIAAYSIWTRRKEAGGPRNVWIYLAGSALAAGTAMAVPGFGIWFLRAGGLNAPILDIGHVYHPEKMLAITLSTFSLGAFAYCKTSKEALTWRENMLLGAACGSFVLMLPWTGALWNAVPKIAAAIQFPHRFGEVLAIATAGLCAAAIHDGVRRKDSEGARSVVAVASVALLVIGAGIVTWRADWKWVHDIRHRTTYQYNETENVDPMYVTYVSPDHLPGIQRLLGINPASDRIYPTAYNHEIATLVQGKGSIRVVSRNPRELVISYSVLEPSIRCVAELYSPLWKGQLSGEKSGDVRTQSSKDGLLEVPLIPDHHKLKLVFDLGWPERVGRWVTLACLFLVTAGMIFDRPLINCSADCPNKISERP